MRGAASAAALLLLAGCGSAAAPGTADSRTSVHGDGPYAVGTEMDPGVWSTRAQGSCGGYSATTRDFDVTDPHDPDAFLAGSALVGDVQRIVLHRGEFFFSRGCSDWSLEDGPNRAPDPATTEGGCAILVGKDDLVRKTLGFGHLSASKRDASTGSQLQDRLFAVVVARNKKLGDAAGQLVDYLDDPDAYNVGAGTIPKVTRAVDRIRSVCRTN